MAWFRGKLSMVLIILQAIFLVLFGVLVEYDPVADARTENVPGEGGFDNSVDLYYAMFQDVHVMIFIGFGFLMTFLRKYSWGSVGFNFLLAAFVLEWATLMHGFMDINEHGGKIFVNIQSMLVADFTAAAVLISMGAVLGKVSPLQLVVMGFIEVIFVVVNDHIAFVVFEVVDVGGSMVVHAFGAYFGLTVSRILAKEPTRDNAKESTSYTSDLFSILGTVFLWMFWPSFNSALATGDARHRAVLNTYYSLAACTIVTFAFSALMNKEGKVQMGLSDDLDESLGISSSVALTYHQEYQIRTTVDDRCSTSESTPKEHIQNATLAGGVAVGTSADLMIHPWGAILIGCVAGFVSTFGFKYVTPWLASKLKIHDTCGVNNLHGMPAIIAGLGGAVCAAIADTSLYTEKNLYSIFPARNPNRMEEGHGGLGEMLATETPMEARSASGQAGYQLAALAVTLVIAIVGGLVTGFILKLPIWNEPKDDELYDDVQNWELPDAESEVMLNGHSPSKKPLTMQQEADDKV